MMKKIQSVAKLYDRLNHKALASVVITCSLLLAFISEFLEHNTNGLFSISRTIFTFFPLILMNLAPTLITLRFRSLKLLRRKPMYSIYLLLYYLLFIPFFLAIQSGFGTTPIDLESWGARFVNGLNFLSIGINHVILVKYAFIDVVMKKRKPNIKDTSLIFMTYITLGISFGFLYTLISITSPKAVFNGLGADLIPSIGLFGFYMRHIYFSFITLTSVGFGDIYPTGFFTQTLVILEALFGVFLLSFSLGIILSSGDEEEYRRDRKETEALLRRIDYLLEEKVEKMKDATEDAISNLEKEDEK